MSEPYPVGNELVPYSRQEIRELQVQMYGTTLDPKTKPKRRKPGELPPLPKEYDERTAPPPDWALDPRKLPKAPPGRKAKP